MKPVPVEEHPLEIPCQCMGLFLGVAGMWLMITGYFWIGIVPFCIGGFMFVNAPHNYPNAIMERKS